MAQPTDLQTQMSAVQWTNGQRLITGAFVMGLFSTIFAILSGMGTWTNGSYAPNLTPASVNAAIGYTPANRAGDTITGPELFNQTLGLPTIATLDLTYANTYSSMANVIRFGAGNQISYCPEMSCLSPSNGGAPYADHQRTSALISAQTQMDNQAEEQTLGISTLIGTGAKTIWANGTTYAVGANVQANGQIYRAIVAGTSAATGGGPSGYGASGTNLQTDGTVTWKWINASAISTKLGPYIETAMEGGAGFSEGLVTNFQMLSAQYAPNGIAADPTQGSVGIEHDFSNYSGVDCAPAFANCLGMSMAFSGTNQSLTGLQLDGSGYSGSKGGAVLWGLRFVNNIASNFEIDDMSNATVGLGFGVDGFGSSSHSRSAIQDGSTSTVSYLASGSNSDSVWKSTGTAAVGLHLSGTYANAIAIDGTATGSQIVGKGFFVDPVGSLNAYQARFSPEGASPIHQFTVAYDTTNDRTVLQSTHNGVYNTETLINPNGGAVGIGPSGLQLTPIPIASLPTCTNANLGLVEFVSDTKAAAAPTWHGAVTGGGSTVVNSMASCANSGWQYD